MGIGEKWANHRQNGSRRNRNILLGKGLLFKQNFAIFFFIVLLRKHQLFSLISTIGSVVTMIE